MPFWRNDLIQKRIERPIVLDQALVENPQVPVVESIVDAELTAAIPPCSALAGLEAAVGLVDDVGAAAAADHAVIPVTALERLERIADLHGRPLMNRA